MTKWIGVKFTNGKQVCTSASALGHEVVVEFLEQLEEKKSLVEKDKFIREFIYNFWPDDERIKAIIRGNGELSIKNRRAIFCLFWPDDKQYENPELWENAEIVFQIEKNNNPKYQTYQSVIDSYLEIVKEDEEKELIEKKKELERGKLMYE